MKTRPVVPLLLFTLLVGFPLTSASAQDSNRQATWGFGPTGGYAVDFAEPFVGALVRFGPGINLGPTIPMLFDGGFEYYFNVEGATVFALTASALAQFPVANSPIRPTAGAGLSLSHTSFDTPIGGFSDTSINLNLQGGIMVSLLAIDGIFRLGDGSDFIIRGAVMFGSLFQ